MSWFTNLGLENLGLDTALDTVRQQAEKLKEVSCLSLFAVRGFSSRTVPPSSPDPPPAGRDQCGQRAARRGPPSCYAPA